LDNSSNTAAIKRRALTALAFMWPITISTDTSPESCQHWLVRREGR
jgi:hypothetical protein